MSTLLKQVAEPQSDSTKRPWQLVLCPLCGLKKIRQKNISCLECLSARPFTDPIVYEDDHGRYRRVALTRGQYAEIDESKAIELSVYRYHARLSHNGINYYAARCEKTKTGWRAVPMQNDVLTPPKGFVIDHVEASQTLNNRRFNLRIATKAENPRNARKMAECTSIYKGVYWRKNRSRWRAEITFNGKHIILGSWKFEDEKDAARAYNKKAVELFGEFARLNVID